MIPLVVALVASLAIQTALPDLPRLAVDTFPPAAREAISRAQQAASAQPANAEAAGALGRVLQAWEQWESAHQAYARARALAPKTFEWGYLDAVVLQRLAQHEAAAESLRQAIAIRSDYLPARLKLAEALIETGALAEGRTMFEALVKEAAAEPAAEVGLGRIAAAEGRHADAIGHFERAATLFPELGAAYYGLARSYRALGRTADAERALAQHGRFGPRWPRLEDPVLGSVTTIREDPRALVQRGISLAEAGEIDKAIAEHEAALARDPALTQAHVNLISLYGRAQHWAKAAAHYRAAVAAGANTAEAHYDFGVVLGRQEEWDAAADAYRRALTVNPLHVESRNNLGQILERRRDFQAAAEEYRQAIEARPSFRLARFNFGRMLIALGRNEQAIAELEKLQQPVDAETPRYLFALSTALVRAGRTSEGLKLASDAERLARESGQADLAQAIAREIAKLK